MFSAGDLDVVEVIVFAEGQTEEQFIKRVIGPALRGQQIFLKPQTLNTSQDASGGAVTFDRLKFNARNTLRQKPDAILSTFLDLYALSADFPGFDDSRRHATVQAKVQHLEDALRAAVVGYVGCRAERFIAHIQPHEFEGLLFSDVEKLVEVEPSWVGHLERLRKVRAAFRTPEDINDSFDKKPSKRLQDILRPGYKKVRHGPLAAERITLETIERECPHFSGWMDSLRRAGA
jgi:uncharacterized protein DUF4276